MRDQKEWQQNKAEELALERTGHEFHELGPHLQMLVYLAAEEAWIDYYADQCDYIYECEKERRLLG